MIDVGRTLGPALPSSLELLRRAAITASAAALAILAGLLVAAGYGESLLVLLVGAALFAFIVVRPDLALLSWVAVLLAWGRDFSRIEIGPLYATEPFLLLVAFAVALRLSIPAQRRHGLGVTLVLVALLAVPAVAGLLLRTELGDPAWMRQFAIIHYSVFAVVAAVLAGSTRFVRRLLVATLLGASAGLVVVALQGQSVETSTGALRIAHGSYAIPFGVAPLLIIALVREGLVRKSMLWATVPLLAGLLLTNHRSGWVAFAAALLVVLAARPAAGPRLALVASALAAITLLASLSIAFPESAVADSVDRALTVFDTSDPNATYRLSFWSSLIEASVASPLIGSGFDPYPAAYLPEDTTSGEVDFAPHNSFVALAYRIGPVSLALTLVLLGWLIARSLRLATRDPDPRWRASLTGSAAAVVHIGVYAAFNVVLELPYMAVLFWVAVGTLASLAATRAAGHPFDREPESPAGARS